MIKYILVSMMTISFAFGSYSVGQTISSSDQNLSRTTCYAGNGYSVGDSWKLADLNGAVNGGQYNVMFIPMHATW